jgi:hypothetical protein
MTQAVKRRSGLGLDYSRLTVGTLDPTKLSGGDGAGSDFVSSRLGELHISRETKSEQEANQELRTEVLPAIADLDDRQ